MTAQEQHSSPMTPDEVIAFKKVFFDAGESRLVGMPAMIAELCSYTALCTLSDIVEEHEEWARGCEERGDTYASSFTGYETVQDFAFHVGKIAATNAFILNEALSLPGSEWPETTHPPHIWAEQLADLGAAKAEQGAVNDGIIELTLGLGEDRG